VYDDVVQPTNIRLCPHMENVIRVSSVTYYFARNEIQLFLHSRSNWQFLISMTDKSMFVVQFVADMLVVETSK
jgi:hypothetical protein